MELAEPIHCPNCTRLRARLTAFAAELAKYQDTYQDECLLIEEARDTIAALTGGLPQSEFAERLEFQRKRADAEQEQINAEFK